MCRVYRHAVHDRAGFSPESYQRNCAMHPDAKQCTSLHDDANFPPFTTLTLFCADSLLRPCRLKVQCRRLSTISKEASFLRDWRLSSSALHFISCLLTSLPLKANPSAFGF